MSLHLEDQLCFSLYRAARSVIRSYAPLLEELGITYQQYLMLMILWDSEEPVTLESMEKRLQPESGTFEGLVQGLEESGLATVENGTVTITQKGIDLKPRAVCIPETILNEYRKSGVDLVEFRESLEIVREAGEASKMEYPN
ncbi:MarR family winged helix-turn-helix transcriptional regulator [Corynebacterium minutissimum]|uniref:MarR family winged helix-turn-helix transcriptional regulator n=1 Tax=Corynebacterium minutissimum TaxID=38301 RepID=UPI001EF35C1D|nr:MarR family transcriptional regulator [Corynebacterium minutissimum]MCG7228525.1 MarR family transcriptional regulator [Corynebacterium minutissimum]MCG7237642.1 MarR family transcriptional regulator [Corynebacterium minutissimum]